MQLFIIIMPLLLLLRKVLDNSILLHAYCPLLRLMYLRLTSRLVWLRNYRVAFRKDEYEDLTARAHLKGDCRANCCNPRR
jgi:hypothetical protein